MSEPFFWESRRCWYFKDGKRRNIRLSPDKSEAFRLWAKYQELEGAQVQDASLDVVFAAFLDDLKYKASAAQVARHAGYLAGLLNHFGPRPVRELTPNAVMAYVTGPHRRKRKKVVYWSDSSQRAAIASIKQALAWAVSVGRIPKSPIVSLKLPEGGIRTTTITREQHEAMVVECRKHPAGRPLATFLIALWHSGARPSSLASITARDVAGGVVVLRKHKTRAKTGKPLVIYPSPCLQTLLAILAKSHPQGPLLRNVRGRAWRKDGICLAFARVRKRAGLPEEISAYAYRHSFGTNALLAGNNLATVAQLLGHTDTRMVSKVYSHLDQHADHLKSAVIRTITRE